MFLIDDLVAAASHNEFLRPFENKISSYIDGMGFHQRAVEILTPRLYPAEDTLKGALGRVGGLHLQMGVGKAQHSRERRLWW